MSEYYVKGSLRTVIRQAKEAVLIYRPDLGLATRTAFYADNAQLKSLMTSELLEAKEMIHGIGVETDINEMFRKTMDIDEEFKVEETPFVYTSEGTVEYYLFTSSGGNLLINKKMLKAIKKSAENRFYTNKDRSKLIIKRASDIVAIIMTFAPEDMERVNQIEW